MLPLEHPDRIQISFDDHRLVANAGLFLPVTLAQHLVSRVNHSCRRIASNQMLLNFGRTRSLGRFSHEIARWLASVVGKTRRNASANLFWAFVMSGILHLIDTRRGSPNCHYVNRFVRGFRPTGSRRISPACFRPSRLRMRHIIHPQVVAQAIQSTPIAAHSVATIAYLAFRLAGTILIPDCTPPKRLSTAFFPQLSPAPIYSSGRSRP